MMEWNTRVESDGILGFSTKYPKGGPDADGRPFLPNPATFQILDKNPFQIADCIVVVLDKLRELTDSTTDVNTGCGIRNLDGAKDTLQSLVRLELLRDMHNCQCSSVERLKVFRGPEPLMSKPDHVLPIEIYHPTNKEGDEVGDSYVGKEDVAADVADGEHAEFVSFLGDDFLEVESDVDGDEDAAG